MRLSEYVREDLVVLGVEETEIEGLFSRFAADLAARDVGASQEQIRSGLLERELAHPTSLGSGVAIPHAMIPGVQRTTLLVARLDQPVPFTAVDDEPVRLCFVLISPPARGSDHIKLLARICRLIKHPGMLESILSAPDAASVRKAVEEVDALHV